MPKLNPRKCDRCGKRISYPNWIKSSWGNYYCNDLNACAKRASKRKEKKA